MGIKRAEDLKRFRKMDTISSEIPREVGDILRELSVIGSIPSASKLNVSSGTYASINSYVDAMWRRWYGDSKKKTTDHIKAKIDEAVNAARKYPEWKEIIRRKVYSIRDAIINLKHVYAEHPRTVADLDTILLLIEPSAFDNSIFKTTEVQRSSPIPIPGHYMPGIPMSEHPDFVSEKGSTPRSNTSSPYVNTGSTPRSFIRRTSSGPAITTTIEHNEESLENYESQEKQESHEKQDSKEKQESHEKQDSKEKQEKQETHEDQEKQEKQEKQDSQESHEYQEDSNTEDSDE